MKGLSREFIGLSLGTVFVFLIVTHYTGAAKTISALGQSGALVYRTLQGR